MGKPPLWPRLRQATGIVPPPPPPPQDPPSSSSSSSSSSSNNGGGGPDFWEDRNDDRVAVGKSPWSSCAAMLPAMIIKRALKASLAATLVLYVLNQKHMLPRPLSAIVSHVLFWPTLPLTLSRRIGTWTTVIDDTVILGGAPIGGWPERLYYDYNVRGVINLCREYRGPIRQYQKLGMEELYLPTTDHFEPTVVDLETAVHFIAQYQQKGDRVYVHCRAGHGRSAAVVYAWLLRQEMLWRQQKRDDDDDNDDGLVIPPPHDDQDNDDNNEDAAAPAVAASSVDLEALNQKMSRLRNVRTGLWRQPNIRLYHRRLIIDHMVRQKKQPPKTKKEEQHGGDDDDDDGPGGLRPSAERQQEQLGHFVDDDNYNIDKEF